MEDLRDYRDATVIKKSRNDIIKDILNDTSDIDNEAYIFPV